MNEKNFFEVFRRYAPTEDKRALLLRAHSNVYRYSKDPMRVEVELHFDSHEDAELYRARYEGAKAAALRHLYNAKEVGIKTLYLVPECGHLEAFSSNREVYTQKIHTFIKENINE